MKLLVVAMFIFTGSMFVQENRTYVGVVTDAMCASGDHSRMRMGANDAECAIACVDAHGAQFVLYDGKDAYVLSDQQSAETFAGKKVSVTGVLNTAARTIQVSSIAPAN